MKIVYFFELNFFLHKWVLLFFYCVVTLLYSLGQPPFRNITNFVRKFLFLMSIFQYCDCYIWWNGHYLNISQSFINLTPTLSELINQKQLTIKSSPPDTIKSKSCHPAVPVSNHPQHFSSGFRPNV